MSAQTGAKVLVFGSTGHVGKYLIQKLTESGFVVSAFVRDEANLEDFRKYANVVHKGDATVDSTLNVFKGIDVVISCMGARGVSNKKTFWDIDFQANMNVLNKCLEAGVSNFYFLSMVGADQFRKDVPLFEARERVVDALKNSKLFGAKKIGWKVIRCTPMFQDLSELYLMSLKNSIFMIGDGTTTMNPIHPKDVAEHLVSMVSNRNPSETGEVSIGGPETMTVDDIFKITSKVVGRESLSVMTISPFIASFAATVVKPFSPNMSSSLDMLTAWTSKTKSVTGNATGHRKLIDFFNVIHLGRDCKTNPGFRLVDVPNSSFYQRKFEIKENQVGSSLIFTFNTLGGKHDISFGVFYSKIDDLRQRVLDPILPQKRFDSHLSTIQGNLKLEKAGFYYARWDNSYSTINPKVLEYKIVVQPTEQKEQKEEKEEKSEQKQKEDKQEQH